MYNHRFNRLSSDFLLEMLKMEVVISQVKRDSICKPV